MKENYEILLNDNLWILYPKCRDGLEDAMEEVYDRIADGMDKDDFRIVYSRNGMVARRLAKPIIINSWNYDY